MRSWVVFAMAGVSRDSGSKLLAIVYPDSSTLYLGVGYGHSKPASHVVDGAPSPPR
ncbi:membrane protein [Vibrio sp. JCM 18905]|nr:membrane protein [Vibrio sp. JCM 18905]